MKGIVFRTEIILLSAAAVFLFLLRGLPAAFQPPEGVTVRTEREAAASLVVPVDGPELDINTARAEELTELPGIGEVLAGRIVAYREENGPFAAIEDIRNVQGIGEKTFAALAGEITVGPAGAARSAVPAAEPPGEPAAPAETETKLNINTARAEELTELPGIGEVLAGRIVAYREENGPFAAIEDLRNVQGIGPGTLAAVAERITVGDAPGG